jgi:Mn-dependent DtxR family transcriptional regulator
MQSTKRMCCSHPHSDTTIGKPVGNRTNTLSELLEPFLSAVVGARSNIVTATASNSSHYLQRGDAHTLCTAAEACPGCGDER